MKAAAVQMASGPSLEQNLAAAERLVAAAAQAGASLVVLPENFYLIGAHEGDKVKLAEREGDGPIQACLARAAATHGVWLVGGTVPLAASVPGRIRSACLVYDAQGRRIARYDKMHLFRFEQGEERYDETRAVEPGTQPLAIDTPFGRMALSVCYDVRFPELYRSLGEFDVMLVPSAFTVPTGAAHWHVLLRARAVENQCYVVAPAQGGQHAGGRRTYGHSVIVDPWGEIVAERAEEGEGMALAELSMERVREVRASLPALKNRRLT